MKTIFSYNNYKNLVLDRLKLFPKAGHGQFRKIAAALRVNPVIVTMVFKGSRDLSIEQAMELADYLGFTRLESDYFLILVQKERAGTHKLKEYFETKRVELEEKSRDLKNRMVNAQALSEEAKALFYSNWFFSGVRLASSIPTINTPEQLAQYLSLPLPTIHRVLEFLLAHGLVVQNDKGLDMGPARTHIEASSPLVSRHHMNWRTKALQRIDRFTNKELFFTGPVVFSENAQTEVREILVQAIEKFMKVVQEAPSEKLSCINIDLFNVE